MHVGCFRNKAESYNFFLKQAKPIQWKLEYIYMYTYKLYFQLLHHPPPSTSWFLLATHNGKAKMENLEKKKKVDSISMIQLAICYGIQGDSFSHTLA